jgi:hypothetical protein
MRALKAPREQAPPASGPCQGSLEAWNRERQCRTRPAPDLRQALAQQHAARTVVKIRDVQHLRGALRAQGLPALQAAARQWEPERSSGAGTALVRAGMGGQLLQLRSDGTGQRQAAKQQRTLNPGCWYRVSFSQPLSPARRSATDCNTARRAEA